MVGTTRSRVSFFMNRFRKLGFIHYAGGIQREPCKSTAHCSTLFCMTERLRPRNRWGRSSLVRLRLRFDNAASVQGVAPI